MSFPLGEESTSTDPVDCGVSGAWVEAGESSDIGGGRGGAGGGDPIERECGRHRRVWRDKRVPNRWAVRWKIGEKEEIQD